VGEHRVEEARAIEDGVAGLGVGQKIDQIDAVPFGTGEGLHDEVEVRRSESVPAISSNHRNWKVSIECARCWAVDFGAPLCLSVGGLISHLSRMRRVLRPILALLFFLILFWGWYAYEKGFTSKWRGLVTKEFRKRGVEVSLKRLTLHPLRGFIAKGVQIYETRERRATLALIDEMVLEVNFGEFFRGQPFLEALELHDAHLSLPIRANKPGGPRLEVAKLNARLYLPPQQIYLASASAEIFGVTVRASGRLINPQSISWGSGMRSGASVAFVEGLVKEMTSIRFESTPPLLAVEFNGDIALPEQISVTASFRGEKIRRGDYRWRRLALAVDLRAGVVDLKELMIYDEGGELRMIGGFELGAQVGRFQVRSSLNWPRLLQTFGGLAAWAETEQVVFYRAPLFDGEVLLRGDQGWEVQVLGHVELGKFAYRSVVFDGARMDFSVDGPRWTFREVEVWHRSGKLTGDLQEIPGDFRARMTSTLHPEAIRPCLTGAARLTLDQWKFFQAPRIDLVARGAAFADDTLSVRGKIEHGLASYCGVVAKSQRADLLYENRVLSVYPIRQRFSGGEWSWFLEGVEGVSWPVESAGSAKVGQFRLLRE
jgi:hypothetical protein